MPPRKEKLPPGEAISNEFETIRTALSQIEQDFEDAKTKLKTMEEKPPKGKNKASEQAKIKYWISEGLEAKLNKKDALQDELAMKDLVRSLALYYVNEYEMSKDETKEKDARLQALAVVSEMYKGLKDLDAEAYQGKMKSQVDAEWKHRGKRAK